MCSSDFTCDGGRSWVVAGTITFDAADTFESRCRVLTLAEYRAALQHYGNRVVKFVRKATNENELEATYS